MSNLTPPKITGVLYVAKDEAIQWYYPGWDHKAIGHGYYLLQSRSSSHHSGLRWETHAVHQLPSPTFLPVCQFWSDVAGARLHTVGRLHVKAASISNRSTHVSLRWCWRAVPMHQSSFKSDKAVLLTSRPTAIHNLFSSAVALHSAMQDSLTEWAGLKSLSPSQQATKCIMLCPPPRRDRSCAGESGNKWCNSDHHSIAL